MLARTVRTVDPRAFPQREGHYDWMACQLDRVLVIALCGVLSFAILAFGATEYWAMCTVQVASAALFVIWTLGQVARTRIKISSTPLFVPLILLGVLVAFQLLWPRTDYWYATWVRSLQ